MKLPTLSRPPKPDPSKTYESVSGFVADVVGMPSWSPRLGTKVQGDWPGLVDLFAKGGAHLFIDASADDVAKSQAYSRETFGLSTTPTPDLSIQTPGPLPDERRMVCTKALFIGNAAIPAGAIVDSRGQWARTYPDHFAPAAPAVSE